MPVDELLHLYHAELGLTGPLSAVLDNSYKGPLTSLPNFPDYNRNGSGRNNFIWYNEGYEPATAYMFDWGYGRLKGGDVGLYVVYSLAVHDGNVGASPPSDQDLLL